MQLWYPSGGKLFHIFVGFTRVQMGSFDVCCDRRDTERNREIYGELPSLPYA